MHLEYSFFLFCFVFLFFCYWAVEILSAMIYLMMLFIVSNYAIIMHVYRGISTGLGNIYLHREKAREAERRERMIGSERERMIGSERERMIGSERERKERWMRESVNKYADLIL